jgi:CBS domain-containing protein
VRETHLQPEERFAMQIRHILLQKGRDIVAIAPTATLGDAVQLLAKKRIGAVLVKNGAALAGILSERDVVRAIAAEGPSVLGREIAAYMTKSVTTCTETDTAEDLMEMMTQGRFRHVPVLDERQSVCGLISIGDVVKTRIAETVNEANSLREYISTTT